MSIINSSLIPLFELSLTLPTMQFQLFELLGFSPDLNSQSGNGLQKPRTSREMRRSIGELKADLQAMLLTL